MTRTTPPRPVDLGTLFPELTPFRRTAIRLHPRPGLPRAEESSVGGPLFWPTDEPWPICASASHHNWSEPGTDAAIPLVSVVQIYQRDAHELALAEGSDLLQVLWCPYIVLGCNSPTPRVYWRSAQSVDEIQGCPPPQVAARSTGKATPKPCVVHPEPVTEYPSWDLPDDLRDLLRGRFKDLDAETGWRYNSHLADAPGIKLGGYPSWTQEPYWPDCQTCGQTMQHLLTVSSWEYDGESWRTWLPVEDRGGATGRESSVPREGHAVREAAGIMIGDAGGVYIFQCPTCPDRPVHHHWDCS